MRLIRDCECIYVSVCVSVYVPFCHLLIIWDEKPFLESMLDVETWNEVVFDLTKLLFVRRQYFNITYKVLDDFVYLLRFLEFFHFTLSLQLLLLLLLLLPSFPFPFFQLKRNTFTFLPNIKSSDGCVHLNANACYRRYPLSASEFYGQYAKVMKLHRISFCNHSLSLSHFVFFFCVCVCWERGDAVLDDAV